MGGSEKNTAVMEPPVPFFLTKNLRCSNETLEGFEASVARFEEGEFMNSTQLQKTGAVLARGESYVAATDCTYSRNYYPSRSSCSSECASSNWAFFCYWPTVAHVIA